MATSQLTIQRAGVERIDEIEPLWTSLHDHHVSVTPHFPPPRTHAESWAIRRAEYTAWMQSTNAYFLVAEINAQPVGYAMIRPGGSSTTWQVDSILKVETLAVLPESRGKGVGRQLMEQVMADAAAQGIDEVSLTVVSTSPDAIRFYEQQGFAPQYLQMNRKVSPEEQGSLSNE